MQGRCLDKTVQYRGDPVAHQTVILFPTHGCHVDSQIAGRKGAIYIAVSPCLCLIFIRSTYACVIKSSTASQTRHFPTGSRSRYVCSVACPHISESTLVQNAPSIQKVITLSTPSILPDFLALSSPPTSATANPHIPIAIPLPSESNTPLPSIASTFSYACPTRAPGDHSRMYSVISTLFQGPRQWRGKIDGSKPD